MSCIGPAPVKCGEYVDLFSMVEVVMFPGVVDVVIELDTELETTA